MTLKHFDCKLKEIQNSINWNFRI